MVSKEGKHTVESMEKRASKDRGWETKATSWWAEQDIEP